MRPVQAKNPPNRFSSQVIEYDGALGSQAPWLELEVYEDQTKNIIAENDSPDVGFRWSVNPYRGCGHACAYCMSGDTRISMVDGSTRALADLREGDTVYGTVSKGTIREYVEAAVIAHWSVVKPAHRVTLADGTELIASGDHRLLTVRGYKYVANSEQGEHLTPNDRLLGVGAFAVNRVRAGKPLNDDSALHVIAIEPMGVDLPMYDITTSTSDFIANGIVSHNCYARPTHEYLGFGTGVDFERRIVVKPRAPELLREAFEKKSWQGELIVFSGNTDCYQPLEASWELTRGCLAVCAEYKNPVHIITKSPLIERDVELLMKLRDHATVGVSISVPFWDEKNARAIEPYVATPKRRMKTVRKLADAGIPVSVNVAPIIPGLSDRDIGPILEAAAAAGARSAAMILLRLPGSVKQVFEERLREQLPLAADRVLARTREVRGGKLNDPRFGARMSGEGEYASAIHQLFEQTARRLGLLPRSASHWEHRSTFERPPPKKGQLKLF